jgi:predicted unusual protein kinase regulating ubiquinone biosynthesis (AarF/ABC1/UbiB family)
MLHQETDYLHEAAKTQFVCRMLADDQRFIVPKVFSEYSSKRVLTTAYEPGLSVLDQKIATLSLTRRTRLAQSALDLFLMELFEWGKIQTDPNYGNYRIRLGKNRQPDQLILLDFGAMKTFAPDFLEPFCAMILAAYHEDKEAFLQQAFSLNLLHKDLPEKVLSDFVDIAIEIIEPMAAHHTNVPEYALNKKGHYCWQESQLPKRIAKKAIKQSMTKYFALPPNEFMFINRKLMGVYTFILELRAQFNGKEHLKKYL